MTVVGGRVLEVEARKLEDVALESVSVNIGFDDLKLEGDRLVVKYSYTINYAPKFAEVTVRGELLVEEGEKERKQIKDEWEKKRQLPPSFAEDALTAITYTASAVGTLAAFALNIPAPLNVPRARLGPAVSGTPGSGTGQPSSAQTSGGKTKAA